MKTPVRLFFASLVIFFSAQQPAAAKNPTDLKKSFGVRQFFRASLYTNNSIVDGNVVAFDDMFNDGIDGDDALKMMNPGENFGIMRNAEILAVEARSPLVPGDTVFYDIQNLRQLNYQLKFTATNMATNGMTAYIVDRYLQASTFIDLSANFSYDFTITSDAASAASNRFYILFTQGRMREMNFISLSAAWNIDKNVDINWTVDNERDVDHYTIERGNNGIDFNAIGTKNPLGNNGSGEMYDSKDMNATRTGNYYRISAIDPYGKIKYSAIVNTGILEESTIKIYPNPVQDRKLNIHFTSQPAGKYKFQLSNKMGQVVYTGDVDVTGLSQVKQVTIDNSIAKGMYQLVIIPAAGGNRLTQQVIIW